jgi:cytidine deaminase
MLDTTALVNQAIQASHNAYVPYSGYPVGAALMTTAGIVYTGCNIENAAYPVTMCGERTALFKAVSDGARAFEAIALVTRNGGSPCGACRQALAEFAPTLRVIIADLDGNIHHDISLAELLPLSFDVNDLTDAETSS